MSMGGAERAAVSRLLQDVRRANTALAEEAAEARNWARFVRWSDRTKVGLAMRILHQVLAAALVKATCSLT